MLSRQMVADVIPRCAPCGLIVHVSLGASHGMMNVKKGAHVRCEFKEMLDE